MELTDLLVSSVIVMVLFLIIARTKIKTHSNFNFLVDNSSHVYLLEFIFFLSTIAKFDFGHSTLILEIFGH
jgi:hypothetical protein